MPEKNETPLLSPKFALALQFANEIHGTQQRKGLGAPYISHLMAVSASVLEHGGNEAEAIAALLHDAAEAYLEDIPTPIKCVLWVDRACVMEPFHATELRVLDAVWQAMGLGEFAEHHAIHMADRIALATEARDLMGGLTWPGMVATTEPVIEPLSPRAARTQFLSMFRRLTAKASRIP